MVVEPSIERDRILQEHARRAETISRDFYSLARPANLFIHQRRGRYALAMLGRAGLLPLEGRCVLEVGCGDGGWLADFEAWGARRTNLAGIDLDPARVGVAAKRFCACRDEAGALLAPGADIRCGDASVLPWPESHFDVVVLSTVLSSVLDINMRRAIAASVVRVLKPGAAVLWYDFFVNNPRNPNVRGVDRREIESLFQGCDVRLSRETLAPPIARRLVPVSWPLAAALESLKILNTHYLGLIRRR